MGYSMAFALNTDRIRSAMDPETNGRMTIDSGPQLEYRLAKYSSPEVSMEMEIAIRRKFPSEPVVANDPENPCIMISTGYLNRALQKRNMRDVEYNTRLVKYLIRMIAFINKHYPLCTAPFLWSDYEKLPKNIDLLYRMPSDEELLTISLQ
jgi:hypothetical protein